MKGLIHIYTGDGKGKTTAGVGLSIRCAGNGKKVIYTQFLKDNKSGELNIIKQVENITFVPCENKLGFYTQMNDEEKLQTQEIYNNLLKKVIELATTTDCQLLVLDEVIIAYKFQVIDPNLLLSFLKNKPEELEVVMTGRYATGELKDLADYVSQVTKVKHPYDKGIMAREGIEQ